MHGRGLFLWLAPQVHYLRSDATDGVYVNSALTLASRVLPVPIWTSVNKPIRKNVLGGQEFIWNLNLHYAIR